MLEARNHFQRCALTECKARNNVCHILQKQLRRNLCNNFYEMLLQFHYKYDETFEVKRSNHYQIKVNICKGVKEFVLTHRQEPECVISQKCVQFSLKYVTQTCCCTNSLYTDRHFANLCINLICKSSSISRLVANNLAAMRVGFTSSKEK